MKGLFVWASASCIATVTSSPSWLASPLEQRQVKGGDCTDRSLALKTLRVFNGSIRKATSGGEVTAAEFSFRLGNNLTGESEPCAVEAVSPYDWVNCEHLREPTAPRSSFRYDPGANELYVQGTWICSDKDPEKPLSMDAFGVGSIPFVCQDLAGADGLHECAQEKEVEVSVTVTARPAEG